MRWCFVLLVGAGLLDAQTVEKAWDLAANGRRVEAVQLLVDYTTKSPNDPEARLLLGSLLMEEGDRAGSLQQLTEAVRLRPRSAEAENALGETLQKFGEKDAARRAFKRAVSLDPNYGVARLELGQSLLAAGDAEPAAAHLHRAIELLGGSDEAADAYYLLAKIHALRGDQKEAAHLLQQAVMIRPAFAQAWSDLGQARKALEDGPGAIEALERAVRTDPRDAIAQYRLGAEYLREEKPEEARSPLQHAYQLNPQDQSTMNALLLALRQTGHAEEAATLKGQLARVLRERDERNQDHLVAIRLNNEGAELQKSGDLRGALQKYSEAARRYPEHEGIQVNYAVALLRLGQWTEGLEELHTALLRDPNNSLIRASLKEALAQAPPTALPRWKDEVR